MKICNNPSCNNKTIPLSLNSFYRNKNNKDGYSNRCKDCVRNSSKISYLKNVEYYREDGKERSKIYRKNNPEKIKENSKKFGEKYKEKGYWKNYYQENKKRLKQYSQTPEVVKKRNKRWKDRYKNDIDFKLKTIMRSNFHMFFKDKGKTKNLSFSKTVNYTYSELKKHLEKNFRKGMTWSNFGELWEIHHIKPLNIFSPENKKEIKECWGLDNLTPLWKTTEISLQMGDNIKGNRNVGKKEIYNPLESQKQERILRKCKTKLVLYTYDSFLFDLDDSEEDVLDEIREVFKKYKLNIKEIEGYDYNFKEQDQYV